MQVTAPSIVVDMFAWLAKRYDQRRNARELYGSIVTQARRPVFYEAWGVPDTVQGRFEMILLHLSLLVDRLQREGPAGSEIARAVTETFIADMDDGMREMTFGDLAVPREIKKAAAALIDRHTAYREAAHASQQTGLIQALESQMAYLDPARRLDAESLAHYMLEARGLLTGQPSTEVLAGRLLWPASLGTRDVPGKRRGEGT